MVARFGGVDYLKISFYAFALQGLWISIGTIILPVQVSHLVPEALKNTYLGLVGFFGLLLALVVQPLAGALSDRRAFSWGRRRPYILAGSLAALLGLMGVAGAGGFPGLFVSYLWLQLATNTAQGPYQAFIPDLVPEGRRGLASGAKSLAEVLGVIIVGQAIGYAIGQYQSRGESAWLWGAMGGLGALLAGAMLATLWGVRERPQAPIGFPILQSLRATFRPDLSPAFLRFLLSRFFFVMGSASVQAFALYLVRDVVGLANPAQVTGSLLAVGGIFTLISVFPAGVLSDRWGRRPLIVLAGLLGALGVLLVPWAQSYGHVLVIGAVMGLGVGLFLSANWALAIDLTPPEEAGRYLGLTNLATAGAAAVARLQGPAIDLFNTQSPGQGYTFLLAACVGYLLLGTVLLLKVPERARPKAP